jgi:hypothetical protein
MSVSACLRILLDIDEGKIARLDAMGPLVARVADAFLVVRWPPPKRFLVLTPYSFLLTDPEADALDAAALNSMAAELKANLFGESPAGDVTVLLHRGDEEETARFAAMDHAALKQLLELGQGAAGFGGRLHMLTTTRHRDIPEEGPADWRPIDFGGQRRTPARGAWSPAFQPIYEVRLQSVWGNGLAATAPGALAATSVFEGPRALPDENEVMDFDLACLGAAVQRLEAPGFNGGILYVPIAFASITRASNREAYRAAFQILPPGRRSQLAAVLYAVPRIPPPRAIAEIRPMLGGHFTHVEIQIDDAGFDIEQFPNGVVQAASLRLPKASAVARGQEIRRFLANNAIYARKNVQMGFTNVVDRNELARCMSKEISYVSGPAVGGLTPTPSETRPYPAPRLPVPVSIAA